MSTGPSPAIVAFAEALGDAAVFTQVQITRSADLFQLRHVDDAGAESSSLRLWRADELRELAMETARGEFRPLKSAPNLRTGWICRVKGLAALEDAMDRLYPGGVSDWHVGRIGGQATCYRDFTARQTGMYRITGFLDEVSAPPVIAACCDQRFCLKDRRWNYDDAEEKPAASLTWPCLEPCALLLEFARKAVRISQEPTADVALSGSELDSLLTVLENADNPTEDTPREADFGDDRNLRRLLLLKQRLADSRQKLREQPEK